MKAYFFKEIKDDLTYICTKFDNSSERVTIFHDDHGIFQQHLDIGWVKYEEKRGILEKNVSSSARITKNDVGSIVRHVWRPGLCIDIPVALEVDKIEMSRAKRELKILIEKLHEILLFIEPDNICMKSYGHKIRELLILACTECEHSWVSYLKLAGMTNTRFTTKDYVLLKKVLYLNEYVVNFSNFSFSFDFQPFKKWNESEPTKSLCWYDGYNKSKHDLTNCFHEANLENCLYAIAANIVMFCVRYSPYELIDNNDICSNLINEFFSIRLLDPDISSFYIPYIQSVHTATGAFSGPLGSRFEKKWKIKPFFLEEN